MTMEQPEPMEEPQAGMKGIEAADEWYAQQLDAVLSCNSAEGQREGLKRLLDPTQPTPANVWHDIQSDPPFVHILHRAFEYSDTSWQRSFVATATDLLQLVGDSISQGVPAQPWMSALLDLLLEYTAETPLSQTQASVLIDVLLVALRDRNAIEPVSLDAPVLVTRLLQLLLEQRPLMEESFWKCYVAWDDRARVATVFDGLCLYHPEKALAWVADNDRHKILVDAFDEAALSLVEEWGRPRLERLLRAQLAGRPTAPLARGIDRIWRRQGFASLFGFSETGDDSPDLGKSRAHTVESLFDDGSWLRQAPMLLKAAAMVQTAPEEDGRRLKLAIRFSQRAQRLIAARSRRNSKLVSKALAEFQDQQREFFAQAQANRASAPHRIKFRLDSRLRVAIVASEPRLWLDPQTFGLPTGEFKDRSNWYVRLRPEGVSNPKLQGEFEKMLGEKKSIRYNNALIQLIQYFEKQAMPM